MALVYVDDVLLTGNFFDEITRTKAALDHQFTIKDLGLAKYFLGIEICTTNQGLTELKKRSGARSILEPMGALPSYKGSVLGPRASVGSGNSMVRCLDCFQTRLWLSRL